MKRFKISLSLLFVLCSLIVIRNTVEAKKLEGYIVTEKNDTIHGEIKVHTFNRRTGGFVFNGIDLEWCYLNVSFREKGKFSFKYYSPSQIKAYEFKYQQQDYIFHRFVITSNSIVKSEREQYQFLNLVNLSSEIGIYRRQRYITDMVGEMRFYTNRVYLSLIPQYIYYWHTNGTQRVISNRNQQVISNTIKMPCNIKEPQTKNSESLI